MRSVWLINLFGVPYAPSSFNPDNSLAALAGSLKEANFRPRIIDYQTVRYALGLISPAKGKRLFELVGNLDGKPSPHQVKEIAQLDHEILQEQLQIVASTALDLVKKAKEERPLFIGFKLYSGEGNLFSRTVASILRKHLDIPLIGGGPLIRVLGGQKYLEIYKEFDGILDGEADRSIVSLAKYYSGEIPLEKVQGFFTYLKGREEIVQTPVDVIHDIGELADPCYDEDCYPALYEKNQKSYVFQIDESRGCPNRCSFCVHPHINDHLFRIHPPKKIIRQIKAIQGRFHASAFRFTGSNTPKKFLREFSHLVEQENLNIQYSCYASVNTTDQKILPDLRRKGLVGLFIGAESSDQETLVKVFNKKGQTNEALQRLVQTCLENDIYITTSWIYPMPHWTEDIKQNLLHFITKLYAGASLDAGSVMVVPSGLLPNTQWFSTPEMYGFRIDDFEQYYKSYAEANMRFWLPRSLIRPLDFSLNDLSFHQLSSECDSLIEKLAAAHVPLGITDDWMLQGKLSGRTMKDFKNESTKALLTGDYHTMESLVADINNNSRNNQWMSHKEQKIS